MQSISKVLSLTLAMTRYKESEIWSRVGKEPSGLPFNSLVLLEMEKGIPRNPFINAGQLLSRICCSPASVRRVSGMLEFVRKLTGSQDITYDFQGWRVLNWNTAAAMLPLPS